MSEWLAVEAIVRQKDKETQANAIAKLSSESMSAEQAPNLMQRDLSNDVFEDISDYDYDSAEEESREAEGKQKGFNKSKQNTIKYESDEDGFTPIDNCSKRASEDNTLKNESEISLNNSVDVANLDGGGNTAGENEEVGYEEARKIEDGKSNSKREIVENIIVKKEEYQEDGKSITLEEKGDVNEEVGEIGKNLKIDKREEDGGKKEMDRIGEVDKSEMENTKEEDKNQENDGTEDVDEIKTNRKMVENMDEEMQVNGHGELKDFIHNVIVTNPSVDITCQPMEITPKNNLDSVKEENSLDTCTETHGLVSPARSTCVSPASSNGGVYSVSFVRVFFDRHGKSLAVIFL